jgi:hypothetical protein
MTGIQQLTRFHNHFDYMLVAVPSSTTTRIEMKKEDVHFGATAAGGATDKTGSVFA